MCQEMMQPASPSNPATTASASSDPLANPGTWAESFPPKLDATVIDQMKTKFLASYPSELVNHDTMPSTRLLSLVHHQLGKKQWAWIPWKYRLTMAKSEEVTSQRQTKMPKLEVASLHHLLVDEPPAIDISNTGFGVSSQKPSCSTWHGSCDVRWGPSGQSQGLFSQIFGFLDPEGWSRKHAALCIHYRSAGGWPTDLGCNCRFDVRAWMGYG